MAWGASLLSTSGHVFLLALSVTKVFPDCVRAADTELPSKDTVSESNDMQCARRGRAMVQRNQLLAARSVALGDPELKQGLPATQAVATDRQDSCAELVNRGTHFTIKVDVGTPPQSFDVVTDTGSNALIVRSCICQSSEGCSSDQGKCFTGTNQSSTFEIADSEHLSAVVLTFGSGTIEAVIATDDVKIGNKNARMKDALLLMVDRELDLTGPFEGILGLGIPRTDDNETESSGSVENEGENEGMVMNGLTPTRRGGIQVSGFMDLSGTKSFSVCFNDGENGVLRMDPPDPPSWLGSIGQAHWGLDFRGVTVHGATSDDETTEIEVKICTGKHVSPEQETSCGIIPDSGTTVIMAPGDHIKMLFKAVCKAWPRCKKAAKKEDAEPHEVMQALLFECKSWLGSSGEIGKNAGEALNNELPSLRLKVADADGTTQELTLDPVDYIIETISSEMHYVARHLADIFPMSLLGPADLQAKVCAPAFGVMDFDTKRNGPVWILGTPIFYRYQVGYNAESTPPGISFVEDSCGSCDNHAMLVSHGNESRTEFLARKSKRSIRQQLGPLRVSNIDTSKGL